MPQQIYQNHRDSQRVRILEAAEALFIRSGIDNVSMAQIAAEARISRVTLYEYFPNREETAWAVFQKVANELGRERERMILASAGSGLEKIEQLLAQRTASLETHPDQLRFIAIFNFLYAREGGPARMRGLLEQGFPGVYDIFAGLVREGIADGSIDPNLDPDLISAAIGNLTAGMSSRFVLLGDNVREEYGYEAMRLYRELCRVFVRGLKKDG